MTEHARIQTPRGKVSPTLPRWKLRCALIGVIGLAVGCTASYGQLVRSRGVDAQFNRYEVRPDYRYYSFGSQNAPMAIMGIDDDYTLTTSVWTSIASPTQARIKARVEGMTDQLGFSPANYGGLLLTPEGSTFGVWYSAYTNVVIRFDEGKTVSVSPPRRTEQSGDRPFLRLRD